MDKHLYTLLLYITIIKNKKIILLVSDKIGFYKRLIKKLACSDVFNRYTLKIQ